MFGLIFVGMQSIAEFFDHDGKMSFLPSTTFFKKIGLIGIEARKEIDRVLEIVPMPGS